MPKLSQIRKSKPKRPKQARKPAPKAWAVVRGRRNPKTMLLQSSEPAARKAAAWLRSHFPGRQIRVTRIKTQ